MKRPLVCWTVDDAGRRNGLRLWWLDRGGRHTFGAEVIREGRQLVARTDRWTVYLGCHWEPRDLWVGVYWDQPCESVYWDRALDVYLCLIPTLPLCAEIRRVSPAGQAEMGSA